MSEPAKFLIFDIIIMLLAFWRCGSRPRPLPKSYLQRDGPITTVVSFVVGQKD